VSVILVIAGAAVVVACALGVTVWLVGRADARTEAAEAQDMRQSGPPILGDPDRPRHLHNRRWT
jgi:hypothetical protein